MDIRQLIDNYDENKLVYPVTVTKAILDLDENSPLDKSLYRHHINMNNLHEKAIGKKSEVKATSDGCQEYFDNIDKELQGALDKSRSKTNQIYQTFQEKTEELAAAPLNIEPLEENINRNYTTHKATIQSLDDEFDNQGSPAEDNKNIISKEIEKKKVEISAAYEDLVAYDKQAEDKVKDKISERIEALQDRLNEQYKQAKSELDETGAGTVRDHEAAAAPINKDIADTIKSSLEQLKAQDEKLDKAAGDIQNNAEGQIKAGLEDTFDILAQLPEDLDEQAKAVSTDIDQMKADYISSTSILQELEDMALITSIDGRTIANIVAEKIEERKKRYEV